MSVDNDVIIIPKEPPPVPKLAMAAIVVLLVAVIAIVIHMRSKPGRSFATIPGEELTIGIDRVTLYVPKDAITMVGVITISSLESNLYSNASDASKWFRSQVVDVKYLDGKGIPYQHVTFPKPALICFMIEELWQDYTEHPDEYLVQYYAEEQNSPGWVSLPISANPDKYQVCGQTDHLSIFALAVRPQTEIPITGATLTSTPTGFLASTPTLAGVLNQASLTASSGRGVASTPVSTQAALTATSVALTATDVPTAVVPPTNIPTAVPTDIPTVVPTNIPTNIPTIVVLTNVPPTNPPPTDPPTEPPPPTDPPTKPPPPPTDPPVATDPPVVP